LELRLDGPAAPTAQWDRNQSPLKVSSDVAPYSALDFVTVCASDFSTPVCFKINSHCFRACVLDSSINSAAVVVRSASRAYSKGVNIFAFSSSNDLAWKSAAAPSRIGKKLLRLGRLWSFAVASLPGVVSTKVFA